VPNLGGEGLPVDIKTGARRYVVGPLSVRPDGGFYDPVKNFGEKFSATTTQRQKPGD